MTEKRYRAYLLLVLMVIHAFNQMDRLALGLLMQSIKVDLALSDTQLGLLAGFAFAVFYSLMGVPIARWADRGNRVTIISVTTAVWCGAVALCAAAANFTQMLLTRIVVAIGEAGCKPTAYSLIADHFSREERPRAVGRYMLGAPLSIFFGYFVAGWLNELYGWRVTFVILGLPGLAVAALAAMTLREPRDRGVANSSASSEAANAAPSFLQAVRQLWSIQSFRHILLCYSVLIFFTQGIGKWMPSFFVRTYEMRTGELGTWLAIAGGVGGLAGTLLGAEWASRYAKSNERLQMRAIAVACCGYAGLSALVYVAPSRHLAFMFMTLGSIGITATVAPLFATIQTLVPSHARATAIATMYLFANLVGMGLGPSAVGALSDLLRATAGTDSLRYALLALCPVCFWCAWHAWKASVFVGGDVASTMAAERGRPS